MPDLEQTVSKTQDVAALPEDQTKAVAAAMKNLWSEAQADVVQQARVQLPLPGLEASEKLWSTIVTSFAIVLVGAFFALALIATGTVEYLFGGPPPTGDVMLTVFTTAAGFLAGLLTPSPVKPAPGGGEV